MKVTFNIKSFVFFIDGSKAIYDLMSKGWKVSMTPRPNNYIRVELTK